MTAPIAATEVWQAVMDRAEHRCQCTYQRHPVHRRDPAGQCWHGDRLEGHLIAGPVAPSPRPERTIDRTPVEQLMAWCLSCWSYAVKQARARADAAPPQDDSLW